MKTVEVPLSDQVTESLDYLIKETNKNRNELIRQALSTLIEDAEDLRLAKEREGEPTIPFSE